jgi:hypothetical protein
LSSSVWRALPRSERRGDSYRLREKLKAGLLRPKLVSDPADENDNT